ncbi:MAG: tetratricopeptide repeat protein [Phototrophicales bacterium]|nr:tetratricopeptide repeat protein [Phototrophicales bacterium]
MLKQFMLFLGPNRARALFLLLGFTGLGNLLMNVIVNENAWARDVQTILVFVFLIGTSIIIISALDSYERGRWIGIIAPVIGALLLCVIFFPPALPIVLGGGVGWIFAGVFLFRPRTPDEYKKAVRALRKSEYSEAVKNMDMLIKTEPDNPFHYRFRAEVLRVWGKLPLAKRDYKKMTDLAPDMAVAWNGLAEIELQIGDYKAAHVAALKSYQLAPDEWVAVYNLGAIEDRLNIPQDAIEHLRHALNLKIPDARHRMLAHLYLARAHARLKDYSSAEEAVKKIQGLYSGIQEWRSLMKSDQATTLRDFIEADVNTATALADGDLSVQELQ